MVQHVIIGAGAAGVQAAICLLSAGRDVLLIERGPGTCWSGSKGVSTSAASTSLHEDPILWGDAAYSSTSTHSMQHNLVMQSELAGRFVTYPQGCGIGGCLNVNAMIWSGGHRRVFDKGWPSSWSSEVFDRYVI